MLLCQSNRHLRGQRIVNLWNNVFQVRNNQRAKYECYSEVVEDGDSVRIDRLYSSIITKVVGTQVAEAVALAQLGMPPESFSVLLEGNPIPRHTSTVFRIVQQYFAQQLAINVAETRGLIKLATQIAYSKFSTQPYSRSSAQVLQVKLRILSLTRNVG